MGQIEQSNIDHAWAILERDPDSEVTMDLSDRALRVASAEFSFDVDDYTRDGVSSRGSTKLGRLSNMSTPSTDSSAPVTTGCPPRCPSGRDREDLARRQKVQGPEEGVTLHPAGLLRALLSAASTSVGIQSAVHRSQYELTTIRLGPLVRFAYCRERDCG